MQRQLKDQVGHYFRTRHLPPPPPLPLSQVSHPLLALLQEIRQELLALKDILE